MHRVNTGKEEIIYLLTKAIEKYQEQTGQEIIQNTNRKNYESIGIVLSEISNQLPLQWESLGTEYYEPELDAKKHQYPYRKYDITGGQIKDALNGIVTNPRSFLVDACYIYLYGVGRKSFEQNPIDDNLLLKLANKESVTIPANTENTKLTQQFNLLQKENQKNKRRNAVLGTIAAILLVGLIGLTYCFFNAQHSWTKVKKDLNILPYKPTKAEIDSLEGIWVCYTGSPQARSSDPDRYHKVVSNIIDIKYENGYFTFIRYGASFDHIGYMQFQSPGIVSVYSRIKNNTAKTESPRHSLLDLNSNKLFLTAISASWNFDVGKKNKIIGIREIYIKQGKGGDIEEVINEVENASCKCKIIRWTQNNKKLTTFNLKNELLDSLPYKEIHSLINESSILIGIPEPGLIFTKDSVQ
jgi:hypothetical protein